jgi:hypothetical protein
MWSMHFVKGVSLFSSCLKVAIPNSLRDIAHHLFKRRVSGVTCGMGDPRHRNLDSMKKEAKTRASVAYLADPAEFFGDSVLI